MSDNFLSIRAEAIPMLLVLVTFVNRRTANIHRNLLDALNRTLCILGQDDSSSHSTLAFEFLSREASLLIDIQDAR